ncbi:MAG: LysR family transcriptional regulator [Ilumatobacter sp.]
MESLRTLLAVLDHGGMTRAAQQLHLSQSAVSWKIKRLEERVGRPLLIRDGRTIRPTRDARALVDDARSMVEIHDRAAGRLMNTDLTGTVKVGSNEEVDPADMASLLGRFKRTHPGATVEFLIDHTEELARAVDDGEIDVAIIQVDDDHLRLTDTVLWTDELRWVTGGDAIIDQSPLPLITFGCHCFYRTMSEPLLDAAGIEHTVTFSASSISGVRAAIVAGLGVGVLGSRYIDGDVVAWRPGADLPRLPTIHQIVRTVPGDTVDVTNALVAAISAELVEPLAPARAS